MCCHKNHSSFTSNETCRLQYLSRCDSSCHSTVTCIDITRHAAIRVSKLYKHCKRHIALFEDLRNYCDNAGVDRMSYCHKISINN